MDEDWNSPWADTDNDIQQTSNLKGLNTPETDDVKNIEIPDSLTEAPTLTSGFNDIKTPNTAIWGSFGESSAWGDLSKQPAVQGGIEIDVFPDWSERGNVNEVTDTQVKDFVKAEDGSVANGLWDRHNDQNLAPEGYEQWSTLNTVSDWGDENLDVGAIEVDEEVPSVDTTAALSKFAENPITRLEVVEAGSEGSTSSLAAELQKDERKEDSVVLPDSSPISLSPLPEILGTQVTVQDLIVPLKVDLTDNENSADDSLKHEQEAVGEIEDDEDDFGDFADEKGFQDQVTEDTIPVSSKPLSPTLIAHNVPANVPAFSIDTSLVLKLYPIPVSYPNPPPLESEIISTTGARKAWYRLTKAETLRKSNSAGDDDYIVVTWRNSKIKEEVNTIVSRWTPEDRVPRTVGVRGTGSPGAMFGWGEAVATPMLSIGPKKNPQTHSPRIVGYNSPKTKTQSNLNTATPVANFNWGPKDVSNDQSTTLTPRVSSDVQMKSPPRTPVSESNKALSSVSIADVQRQSFQVSGSVKDLESEKSSVRPSSNQEPAIAKEHLTSDLSLHNWGEFEDMNKSPAPSQEPTSKFVDEWGAFENLVSKGGAVAVTSDLQVSKNSASNEIDDLSTLSGSTKSPTNPLPTSANQFPKIDMAQISKANNSLIINNPANAKEPHSSPKAFIHQEGHIPLDASSAIQSEVDGSIVNDDDWGELVETPSGFDEKSFSILDTTLNRPTLSETTVKKVPLSSFVAPNGVPRSNTLPTKITQKPEISKIARIAPSKQSPTKLESEVSVIPLITPNPIDSTINNSGDCWDLSFFEAPSSSLNSNLTSTSLNLWDAPVPPSQNQKKTIPSNDDKLVCDIVNSLPNLNYMLL